MEIFVTTQKEFSVVVMSLGDEAAVSLTIDSVSKQSVKPTECIVFNVDESKYNTFAQVKNDAVKCATYDLVLCLQAGEVLPEGALETLIGSGEIEPKKMFDSCISDGDEAFSLMLVNRKTLAITGGWNEGLAGTEDYELLLRMCDVAQFLEKAGKSQLGDESGTILEGVRVVKLENMEKPVTMETYYAYAYVLGRFAVNLKAEGTFDKVFMAKYNEAQQYGIAEYFVTNAEKMLSRSAEFEALDKYTRPVLVITGESVCYGVLDEFGKDFSKALRKCGQNVIEFSVRNEPISSAIAIAKMRYRAVVGLQSGLFSTDLPNGDVMGNLFDCLKYNFLFDHPLYLSYHLMLPIKNYYILQQDGDYAAYVNDYYEYIKKAYHLPPAGRVAKSLEAEGINTVPMSERKYDMTFVGTYNNYRDRLKEIRKMEPLERKLALKFLNYVKHNPNMPIEKAFAAVTAELGYSFSRRDFVVRLHRMMNVGRGIFFYYREKVVKTLLDADIELHVFSESWYQCPFVGHPCLIIHDNVSYEEGIQAIADSKLSLNIMSWHKDGMTERIANTMLNGAVCVTDKTRYIEKHFENGKNIVLFDLENIEELPTMVRELLKEENIGKIEAITAAAREVAQANHLWEHRAKEFLAILERNESGQM